MRKYLAVFAVLVCCGIGFLCTVVAAVDEEKTEITVSEQTLAGEPSAVGGLVLETYQNKDRHLFWHTTCLAGENPAVTTEFDCSLTTRQTNEEDHVSLMLSVGTGGFGISSSGGLQREETWELSDMMEPAWDVADRTEAGESRTETVRLNEYYDTFQVVLESAGTIAVMNDAIRQEWLDFLTAYFQIPIPDEVLWEVSVTKDELGQVVTVNCVTYPEASAGYANCVRIGSDVYFLIQGQLDVSHIQGGYGIYRIPGELVEEYNGTSLATPQLQLKVKELENIYPLDPPIVDQVTLEAGPQEGTLLLLRQMDDQVRVRILNAESGTSRQELLYEANQMPEIWYCEDLLILVTNRETIRVYALEDGIYQLWMEDTLYPLTDNSAYYVPELAFDGSRLAIVASESRYFSASSRVTVYDETGLLYAGDYSYSSDTLPTDLHLESYNWVEPLQIHWQ